MTAAPRRGGQRPSCATIASTIARSGAPIVTTIGRSSFIAEAFNVGASPVWRGAPTTCRRISKL